LHNNDIAAVFEVIADLLEIEQANPIRISAYYRNAACTIQVLGEEVHLIKEGYNPFR
jgi:DNA polymerase (family 10)